MRVYLSTSMVLVLLIFKSLNNSCAASLPELIAPLSVAVLRWSPHTNKLDANLTLRWSWGDGDEDTERADEGGDCEGCAYSILMYIRLFIWYWTNSTCIELTYTSLRTSNRELNRRTMKLIVFSSCFPTLLACLQSIRQLWSKLTTCLQEHMNSRPVDDIDNETVPALISITLSLSLYVYLNEPDWESTHCWWCRQSRHRSYSLHSRWGSVRGLEAIRRCRNTDILSW